MGARSLWLLLGVSGALGASWSPAWVVDYDGGARELGEAGRPALVRTQALPHWLQNWAGGTLELQARAGKAEQDPKTVLPKDKAILSDAMKKKNDPKPPCSGPTPPAGNAATPPPGSATTPPPASSAGTPCLCIFDIDRTLTAKQGYASKCPGTKNMPGIKDNGYGGGTLVLSELALTLEARTSFCDDCYVGICSAGSGSSPGSSWNNMILNKIMRSKPTDALTAKDASIKKWSRGMNVISPYILSQPDKQKQKAVSKLVEWFNSKKKIPLKSADVFFFGDRTENIAVFKSKGLNSAEISCGSRDSKNKNMVGLCGGKKSELVKMKGNKLCNR